MDEGNTIPFIARYRKEMHGAMDDTVLRTLETRLTYLRNLQERRDEVKNSIENQGKLTEELSAAIDAAATLAEVEDLYRPYKQKRRTRATMAREKGLEPLAAAIGAGLNISEPKGVMVVDIGGGTADIAVISLSGVVESASIKIAGDQLNEAVIKYMRRTHNLLVGERTAEDIKCAIGAAVPELENEPEDYVFTGSNMLTNLPQTVTLNYSEIAYALDKSLVKLDNALMEVLEEMPPELYSDVVKNGIYLAGGGALIKGLDQRLSKKSGLPVHVADDPLRAIARGTCVALKNIGNFSFLMGGDK